MNVTVIVPDGVVVVNGAALFFQLPVTIPGLRAIQWNGASGTMEFETGPQQFFDNPAIVAPYVEAHTAEAAKVAAAQVV